jgi:ribonuclease BN (tRNA processing enzyme)
LAIDAGGLTSSLSIADQCKIKSIILTHLHYDHVRDIPTIAINLFRQAANIKVYSTPSVINALETYLFNGKVYPKFQELPETKPTINLCTITQYKLENIEGYEIIALPVNHHDPTVGYQVRNSEGNTIFYTADTGPGLLECWKHLSPQLLIAEVTVPNRYTEFALNTKHLTPKFLHDELIKFMELKCYLPQVIVVHMDPTLEKEIKEEITVVAEALNTTITIAYEGMELNI